MTLVREFEAGKQVADTRSKEANRAVQEHQRAVELEKALVQGFWRDLKEVLPLDLLSSLEIYPEEAHWSQLIFVHRQQLDDDGPLSISDRANDNPQPHAETSAPSSVAILEFSTEQLQFYYSDFLFDFNRKLPLPPNENSFGLISKYLGETIAYFSMPKCDQDSVRMKAKGFRATLSESKNH